MCTRTLSNLFRIHAVLWNLFSQIIGWHPNLLDWRLPVREIMEPPMEATHEVGNVTII